MNTHLSYSLPASQGQSNTPLTTTITRVDPLDHKSKLNHDMALDPDFLSIEEIYAQEALNNFFPYEGRSSVWLKFKRSGTIKANGKKYAKAKCTLCGLILKLKGSSTTSLSKHLSCIHSIHMVKPEENDLNILSSTKITNDLISKDVEMVTT